MTWYERAAVVLIFAAIWDYSLGDPRNWLHPVQVMGWIINRFTRLTLNFCQEKEQRRLSGIILGLGLIIGTGSIAWLAIGGLRKINPWLDMGIEIILLASCLAGRSLRQAAEEVLEPLSEKELKTARSRLSLYVGRDTENLSESEIKRAILETVAENAVDGVTAPLFYAIVGAFLPGIGSIPLALGYKAASTLDSSIGYCREPYTDLGWFSAQLEDRLTWLPCRLTVLTLAWLSSKPRQVIAVCRRDAWRDLSPNSGWSECVYAAILGVQLGGINIYQGVIKEKPLLGDAINPINEATIKQALQLTRYCCLVWLAIAILSLLALSYIVQ
ncbi:cobalamin biosynthesis protein [Pleurocapsales cyanobacterium LEGE 06147]|nr:cobalamin biosynthesis protein [Pleurocapsales cyanobacterium LEGE 06147]